MNREKLRHLVIDATVVANRHIGVHVAVWAQTRALAEALNCRDDWRLTVIVADPELNAELESMGVSTVFRPGIQGCPLRRILFQQTMLPSLLKRLHADVLFAPAYTAPRFISIPIVLQVHDIIVFDTPELCSWRNRLHLKTLLPASLQSAQRIMTPSQNVRERILARFPSLDARKIMALPLGIKPTLLSPSQETIPPPSNTPYFLFVGALEPKKGIDILLDAYDRLAQRIPAGIPDLVLCGTATCWGSRGIVRRISSRRLPGNVIWRGVVDDAELCRLYRHAVAYIQPSRIEGFGLPVLEALACGTPVICSDHPVLREVADRYALYFPQNSVDELAALLHQFLVKESPVQHLVSPAERIAYAQQFTWQRWAREMVKLLDTIGLD